MRRTIYNITSAIPLKKDLPPGRNSIYIIGIGEVNLDFTFYVSWLWIVEEAEKVRDLRLKYLNKIQTGSSLPTEYDNALQALRLLVFGTMKDREKHIANSIAARSGFRELFHCDSKDSFTP